MLSYTLSGLLTEKAVIQRDMGQVDAYGADGTPDWQDHLTVPCRIWWLKGTGARSANRTYISPARTASVSEGGMMLALGTDVTERDRITQVLRVDAETGSWMPYVEGIIVISAVVAQEDHMELSISRAQLGA